MVYECHEICTLWILILTTNVPRGINISLVILPADNINKVCHKTWDHTFHESKVFQDDILIASLCLVPLINR